MPDKPFHSPAPWHELEGYCGVRTGIMDANNHPIFMLGVKSMLNPADIALILAAPQMLAACKLALNALETWQIFSSFDEKDLAAVAALQEAISSAQV